MGDQIAPAFTLVPEPGIGRVFRSHRPIRLSDAAPDGRLRLDAMARYMQDVASDDVADAHAEDPALTWVVRRTVIEVVKPFGADATVSLATWASGSGSHWAARRTSIAGNAGGRAEAESIWVLIGRAGGRLTRLPAAFDALYGPSTLGRTVSAKLELPPQAQPDARSLPWPLRFADLDTLGHANNAVYWEATETALARGDRGAAGPLRAVLEYRRPVDLTSDLTLAVAGTGGATSLWFIDAGETAACAVIRSA
jgi:acyl-ACP thioesterase